VLKGGTVGIPEQALRKLVEMSGFGTWVCSIPSGEVQVDARWAIAMGYSGGPDGCGFPSWDILVHPDDRQALAAARAPMMAGSGSGCLCEYRVAMSDGDYLWVRERSAPCEFISAPPTGIAGSHEDIDLRRRSEVRLDVQRQLGSAIAACTDYRAALSGALDILSALPPFDDGSALVPSEETGELFPAIQGQTGNVLLEGLVGFRPESSPVCRCCAGSPVYYSPPGSRSGKAPACACMLPVEFGGRMIAVLLFTSSEAGVVPLATREILGSVSQWIGRALSMILNMNRLEEMYRQAREDAEARSELLKEVNHRVKNNLAAIIGMLYAEERFLDPSQTLAWAPVRQDLIRRIEGLAVVHNMLSAVRWAPVPFSDLAESLINAVMKVLPPGRSCSVLVPRSPLMLRSDEAHHFGMLINELAANTLKHAVPFREQVCIIMEVQIQGDEVRLTYRDDGPGFPLDVLALERHSLGFELVRNIVRSFPGGEIAFWNTDGAVVDIMFHRRKLN
jgi:two-component sensor histidine kinase